MYLYFLIFSFQIIFNILKVLEIKYTYQNKLYPLLFNSILINIVSLASIYYSLDRLFQNDWVVILYYILGSVIGKWFAMTHLENIRYRVFSFLKKKNDD